MAGYLGPLSLQQVVGDGEENEDQKNVHWYNVVSPTANQRR
jgi:hypothetical protein